MIQTVCNICKRVLKGNPQVHYCERDLPFAADFERGMTEIIQDNAMVLEKRVEQYRNRYLQESVIPQTRELKMVK